MTGIGSSNERKLRRMLSETGDDLVIGLSGLAETEKGAALPGSLRVYVTRNNIMIMLTPKQARIIAKRFDDHPLETKEADLEWIPQTLREVADEIDGLVRKQN